ncbi:hypothetical protein GmHk_19G054673 [Glycine max]|nr:hypothetical protein GmHk_19G054673 [Glycine max]
MYKDKWTQPWLMGSKIYPEVHENPRAFFNSSSPILLEPLARGFELVSLQDDIECIVNHLFQEEDITMIMWDWAAIDEQKGYVLMRDSLIISQKSFGHSNFR